MVWGQVVAIGKKLAGPLVGLVRTRWQRRQLAKTLHTELYRLIRDRPETHDHPPPFYRETADDLDQAIELELFSDHELEYLAGRLAAYCRAKAQDRSITTVTIDKTYLTWTRLMETDELHPIDVSEIERRLRAELEDTYGRDGLSTRSVRRPASSFRPISDTAGSRRVRRLHRIFQTPVLAKARLSSYIYILAGWEKKSNTYSLKSPVRCTI